MLYVGIDLGTSAVKLLLMDGAGKIQKIVSKEYPLYFPHPGWSEQNPEDWYEKSMEGLKELLSGCDKSQVAGISFGGQMHGLVILDKDDQVIRPAILWNDGRTGEETDYLNQVIGKDKLSAYTANIAFAGFTAPKILWVKKHEPEHFAAIKKIMLPKDYIRYKICGELGTDASDASSTGMWDMKHRTWAYDILKKLDISRDFLVESHEPYEEAGRVTEECAGLTGLAKGTFVAYGGGDSLMMELGNGMIRGGLMASTIGTACHLTCALDAPLYDPKLRTNTWCHGGEHLWSIMGAHLSGGVALKWLKNNILGSESFDAMTALAGEVPAGSEGLLFLPYLNGERTPHNDPNAKAVYLGMTLRHDKRHLIRSTMEGIVYSMKESYAIFRSLGIKGDRIIAAGGGAKSDLFRQIQADMYDCPIYTNQGKEQASIGAAMTAAVGSGYYKDYEEACSQMVHLSSEVTEPIPENVKLYEEEFLRFKEIYFANKALF